MPYASAVYPVPNRFINIGKETAPGTIAAGTYTFPLTTFKPVDKYTMLEDTAWRNAMAGLYNLIAGVRIADVSLGGPLFGDGIGYPLANILGDYYQSVVGNAGTSNSLSGSVAIGATTIVLSAATGFSSGGIVSIGATNTTAEEVRKITNVSGGTLTLNSALYQGHNTGGTVFYFASVTSVNHTFTLLNSGLGMGGWTASQPPTYTYEDFSGVPLATGARNYSYACFSEVSITSAAEALMMWDGKFTALASQIAASTPTVQTTLLAPEAAWRSTVAFAGAGTYNDAEYKLTLTRKISPKFTNSGQQDPFAIARGYLTAGLSFNFDPASDESELLYYLNNTQPTCTLTATNGLAGTSVASVSIACQVAAFDTGELNDSKDVFGFDTTVKCVANTTNIGPSAGYSPVAITLTNGVINY